MSNLCMCATVKIQFNNSSGACKYSIILTLHSVAIFPRAFLDPPLLVVCSSNLGRKWSGCPIAWGFD